MVCSVPYPAFSCIARCRQQFANLRWYFRTSLVYGFPYMIDVHDCDVRLPSSGDSKDLYMDELVRLSVIGGRVVKTIYRYVTVGHFFVGCSLPYLSLLSVYFLEAPQSDLIMTSSFSQSIRLDVGQRRNTLQAPGRHRGVEGEPARQSKVPWGGHAAERWWVSLLFLSFFSAPEHRASLSPSLFSSLSWQYS